MQLLAGQLATIDSDCLTKLSPSHSSSLASPVRAFFAAIASLCMRTCSKASQSHSRSMIRHGGTVTEPCTVLAARCMY